MRATAILSILEGEAAPASIELGPEPATLGRSRENSIILYDEHASRMHARIVPDNGDWVVHDLGTLNGTFVDGERITQPTRLSSGQVISIADCRLSFRTVEDGKITAPVIALTGSALAPPPLPKDEKSTIDDRTGLWADDLGVLYDFMAAAARIAQADQLIAHTLDCVVRRVRSATSGYLSLDPDEPFSKQVQPARAEVDAQLSRQLTRRVQETGSTAWLKGAQAGSEPASSSDSLAAYSDAVCVPVRWDREILGALHVYRNHGTLSQRDVRFCEVVAGFVGSSLSRMRLCRALEAENSRLRMQAPISDRLVGDSQAMVRLRGLIGRAARSNATVLIHGETGVGKELVALALHQQSHRPHGPFVVANCAAVAESLFESEFFGHVRGAFTGAAGQRLGLFQQADDGTLFLDEVGEVPIESQATLLRAIEYKCFRPVGAEQEARADVRIIAATNRDLAKEVDNKAFRQDLYYRLGVIHIAVPPLRDHAEDIPALVEHFLGGMTMAHLRTISPAALEELKAYHWPGNVRQLRAVLESAAIMGQGDIIEPCDLNLHTVSCAPAKKLPLPKLPLPKPPHLGTLNLGEIEKQLIATVMEQVGDNFSEAARVLGLTRDALRRKIKRHKEADEEPS